MDIPNMPNYPIVNDYLKLLDSYQRNKTPEKLKKLEALLGVMDAPATNQLHAALSDKTV